MERTCYKCNQTKDISLFRTKRHICKICYTKYNKDLRRINYKINPEKYRKRSREWVYTETGKNSRRNTRYLREYNIPWETYNQGSIKQKHICPICLTQQVPSNTPLSVRAGSNGTLVVDHCHTTGKIKGLICHKCNAALGLLKESADNLERALNYLKNPPGIPE